MGNVTGEEFTGSEKGFGNSSLRIERLKKAIYQAGGNKVVAKKTAIPLGTLNNYIAGRGMKLDSAIKIAKACDVSLEWLAVGEGSHKVGEAQADPVTVPRNTDDSISIPFFATEASAGNGIVAEAWDEAEHVNVSRSLLRELVGRIPSKLLLMRVRGDSMLPTIRPQDVLLVNYEVKDDLRPGIYVLAVGEMILVKRVDIKNPRTYSIISDNKDYQSFDAPMDSMCWGCALPEVDVRVIGRVMGHFHIDL